MLIYFEVDTSYLLNSIQSTVSKIGYYTGLKRTELSDLQAEKNNTFVKELNLLENAQEKYKIADTASIKRAKHNLYFNGVPDKYDAQGNKLNGQRPDIIKAIQYLQEAIIDTTNKEPEKDILKLAFIYKHGAYNFKPDPLTGAEVIKKFVWIVPESSDIKDAIKELEMGLLDDDEHHREAGNTAGLENLYNIDTDAVNIRELIINNIIDTEETDNNNNQPFEINGRNYRRDIVNNDMRDMYGTDIQEQNRILQLIMDNRAENNRDRGPRQLRDDPQNVHDSSVISSTRTSIDNLKKETGHITNEDSLKNKKEILNFVNSLPSSDKKNDALKALETIYRINAINNTLNVRDAEALDLVWPKIADNQDAKDILVYELSSMIENGIPVCSTGRITRIVDTLNTLDNSVKIVSESVIREEMLNKAAVIRDNFYKSFDNGIGGGIVDTENVDNVEMGQNEKMLNAGNHPNQDQIDSDLKISIKNSLQKDYVDTKLLSLEKFNKIVGEWIDHI